MASENTVCPECGSDNWDWYNNDQTRCKDCGTRFVVGEPLARY